MVEYKYSPEDPVMESCDDVGYADSVDISVSTVPSMFRHNP